MKLKYRKEKLKEAFDLCVLVFGGLDNSIQWMLKNNKSLDHERPLDLISTDPGLDLALKELERKKHLLDQKIQKFNS